MLNDKQIAAVNQEVSVDLDELHCMARKAAKSSRGVSNDGPLRVKILERYHIEDAKEKK